MTNIPYTNAKLKSYAALWLGGWCAIILAFANPYSSMESTYILSLASLSIDGILVTCLFTYFYYLFSSRKDLKALKLKIIALIVGLSPIFTLLNIWITAQFSRLFNLDSALVILTSNQLSNSFAAWHTAQITLIQIAWICIFFSLERVQSAYNNYLKTLGLSQELEKALFRIQAGFIGSNFIDQCLTRIAKEAVTDKLLAKSVVEQLATLMRYAVETSQLKRISITEEMKIVAAYTQLYCDINALKNITIEIDEQNKTDSISLLPMSIFSLVSLVLDCVASPNLPACPRLKLAIQYRAEENQFSATLCISGNEKDNQTTNFLENLEKRINSERLFNFRTRLEKAYNSGAYIDFFHSAAIIIRLFLPIDPNPNENSRC